MYRKIGKRIFDLFLAIFFLPIFIVLIFLLSMYVIIVDGWPPFYISKRVGKDMKIFNMYKIRTMKKNAEEELKKILENKEVKRIWDKYKKLKPDPRLIKGGLFIRKHSLDELPQIFNILKGEMSFVGPRPYLPEELNDIDPSFHRELFSVKPGLTGLWQISGRNKLTLAERVKIELDYVKKYNFFLDLKILFLTIKEILLATEAY